MLYDLRTYTCRPGTLGKHMAIYAKFGYDIQRRHLGEPLVYLQTETGNVNSYTHIWVFANAADRELKRATMKRDSGWISYLEKSAEAAFLVSQENTLMVAASFFNAKDHAKNISKLQTELNSIGQPDLPYPVIQSFLRHAPSWNHFKHQKETS